MSKTTRKISEVAFYKLLESAHHVLRARGFRLEIHREGEAKLGLWRKKYRSKNPREAFPKRFVFVPGFGDTPLSWFTVLTLIEPVLRSQFDEVVLVDFPGYNGRSIQENFFPSIERLIDSLFDALDSLKPHTVVGHSLGGFLTAHYAAACSSGKRLSDKKHGHSELDHAVVIDPSGFFATVEERDEWEKIIRRLVDEGAKFWRPLIFENEPIWFKMLSGPFLKFISKEDTCKFLLSGKPEQEVRLVLPDITSKMSLIWGEKDTLLPASLVEGWVKGLSATKEPPLAVLIRDCGHNPQLEAPVKTAAVLGQILSGRKPHSVGNRWYEIVE